MLITFNINDMRLLRRIVTALAGAAIAGGVLLPHTAARADDRALVVFAIDTSGSLRPADLDRAGELAAGILASLPPGTAAWVETTELRSKGTA